MAAPVRRLPVVMADFPLPPAILAMLDGHVELWPWAAIPSDSAAAIEGIYTFAHPLVEAALIDRLPNLRVISNHGVGVDHIDLAAAARRNIPVGYTPDVLNGAVADMAFALILAAARRLVEGDHFAHSPGVTYFDPNYMLGREVYGTTLGIVGMGRVGHHVARRATGFEMPIRYTNLTPVPEIDAAYDARWLPLETLLAESDHVVLTVPLTPTTRGLIGREQLRRMRPTATLVNISRGPVVDTAALTEALAAGWIYAAALDVTEPEPLPRDHPLLSMANVILTPHLGSATVQTRETMARISVENLLNGLRGEKLPVPYPLPSI